MNLSYIKLLILFVYSCPFLTVYLSAQEAQIQPIEKEGNTTEGMVISYPSASSGKKRYPYRTYDFSKLVVAPDPLSTTTLKVDLSDYGSSGRWSRASNDSSETDVVMIHYRVNKIILDPEYMNNKYELSIIDRTFSNVPLVEEMDFVVIIGAASPEGYTDRNAKLGENRALALKSYIMQKFPYINRDRILTYSMGEDWDGLIHMIESDPEVPARDQLLEMLNMEPDPNMKRAKMKRMNNGVTYQYLDKHMLPYLRGGSACLIYYKKEKAPEIITHYDTVFVERIIYDCPEEPVRVRKPFYIVVKNNLLFDLALLPNLAIEIPFGKNYKWSAEVEGHWSWWNTGADDYHYHRIQMAGVELRHWFANKTGNPLNGWYAGIYGYGGTYDLRLFTNDNDDKGYLSDWSYSAGLSIGYAMPIAKRWNLEFGLGIGYFGGKYKKYDVSDCKDNTFPWLSTHNRNYVGLTKAKVSLVWLIGSGTNRKKGKEVGR